MLVYMHLNIYMYINLKPVLLFLKILARYRRDIGNHTGVVLLDLNEEALGCQKCALIKLVLILFTRAYY